MKKTDRFRNLDEVRLERDRLKGVRDRHQDALEGYWGLLHEPNFRRGLAGDAFGDMLRAWKPLRSFAQLMRSENGALGNVVGAALGARSRTLKGRVFAWLVGAIAPLLLKRFATPERLEHIATEVKRSWDRVKERVQEGA